MQIVAGDGLPNGGLPPLPVMYAVPVTTKPSETGGLNVGHFVFQLMGSVGSLWIMPSVMLMWCVCGPSFVGSWFGSVFAKSAVSMVISAENIAVPRSSRCSDHLPCIS